MKATNVASVIAFGVLVTLIDVAIMSVFVGLSLVWVGGMALTISNVVGLGLLIALVGQIISR